MVMVARLDNFCGDFFSVRQYYRTISKSSVQKSSIIPIGNLTNFTTKKNCIEASDNEIKDAASWSDLKRL